MRKAEGPAPGSRHVESFLEMLAAERGAAANTQQAYERDLNDFGKFLGARGKAVDLTRFSELNFSVSRENDAEYEFDAKILGQTRHGAPAVAIEHTTAIRKLLYRAAPRSPVSIDGHFFVVKEEFASEKRHKAFKRNESQFSLPGHIVDLSLGGLRIMAVAPETRPAEGDIIVFQLPQARIKDDLVAEVLYTEAPTPNEFQMHLRFVGIKELDRLKLNKYLQMQRESEQEAEAQASAAHGASGSREALPRAGQAHWRAPLSQPGRQRNLP